MNKYLKLLVVILFSTSTFSQISVGRTHRGAFKDLRKEDYKEIKNRKTIFVVDSFEKIEFEKMLSTFWKLSDYEVISREQYSFNEAEIKKGNNSIFLFSAYVLTVSKETSSVEYLYCNYNYFYCTDVVEKKDGKLKYDYNEVASVFFAGDAESMWRMISEKSFGNLQEEFYNYKLGFIKNYLQYIQKCLLDNWYSFAYSTTYDKSKIKALSKSKLYIPDYIKNRYNGWSGTDEEANNPDALLKDYKHPYEWISSDDLNEKILNAKEDFYYLMYTKVNSMKMISIVNGKTGDVIYTDYQSMSYKIKSKDLKEISSKIK